jgi:hypothetical protein
VPVTVIDRATVKTNLGITTDNTTYDSKIDAQLPIIDAKVKQICGRNFNDQIVMSTTSGSEYAEIWGIWYWQGGHKCHQDRPSPMVKQIVKDIPVGTKLSGESIPDTSILEIYYDYSAEFSGKTYSSPFVKMTDNATATNTGAQTFYGWNVAYDSIVSKGIWWLISQQSTTIEDDTWTTKKYGPLSVSRGRADAIDPVSGMPKWFVQALPRYHG